MKKYIFIFLAALSFTFIGCDVDTDEEAGGTAIEKMAGMWTVLVSEIDPSGNSVDLGYIHLYTYNTAANLPSEMWIDDDGAFFEVKLKVDINYSNRTFTSNGYKQNQMTDDMIQISEGKITEGGATTPSGMPADGIEFYVAYEGDDYTYKASGFRYTGLPGDF